MPTEHCSACPKVATQIRDGLYVCDGCAQEVDDCQRIRQQESTFSVVDFTRGLCGIKKQTTLTLSCAWCDTIMGEVPGDGQTGTTSGICDPCLLKYFRLTPEQLAEVCE